MKSPSDNLSGRQENTVNPVQAACRPFQLRMHSQEMALEVLKLKVTLNELTVEDLTPSKLRSLADYFAQDVLGAAQ